MASFVPQPVTLRSIEGVGAVQLSGGAALVAGHRCALTTRLTIMDNPHHILRQALGAEVIAKMQRGEIAAVVHATDEALGDKAPRNGRPTYIVITMDQWMLGMDEWTRWTAWQAQVARQAAADRKAERAHDALYNEGAEGYNPHRYGSKPTYK